MTRKPNAYLRPTGHVDSQMNAATSSYRVLSRARLDAFGMPRSSSASAIFFLRGGPTDPVAIAIATIDEYQIGKLTGR